MAHEQPRRRLVVLAVVVTCATRGVAATRAVDCVRLRVCVALGFCAALGPTSIISAVHISSASPSAVCDEGIGRAHCAEACILRLTRADRLLGRGLSGRYESRPAAGRQLV